MDKSCTIPSVSLRAPEPEDLDMLYLWENDPTQWHNSLTPPLTSRHMLSMYLDNYQPQPACGIRMMVMWGGETVGTIDLSDCSVPNSTAFVSIYISERHRGCGIGREALKEAIEIAREGFGIEHLAALIAADNVVSQKLFESVGFQKCGELPGWLKKQGSRQNMLIYSL